MKVCYNLAKSTDNDTKRKQTIMKKLAHIKDKKHDNKLSRAAKHSPLK